MDNQTKNIQDILETVNFIKDNAASKEDLKGFATKEDLERFATKEDLDNFVTKYEFGEFKDEMLEFKDEMRGFRNEVLTNFDGLTKLVKDFQAELAAMIYRVDRLELRLDRIENYLKIEA